MLQLQRLNIKKWPVIINKRNPNKCVLRSKVSSMSIMLSDMKITDFEVMEHASGGYSVIAMDTQANVYKHAHLFGTRKKANSMSMKIIDAYADLDPVHWRYSAGLTQDVANGINTGNVWLFKKSQGINVNFKSCRR